MLVSDQQMPVTEPRTQKETAMRPPLPPFTRETAIQKVRLAEDAWNSRDPEKVALAYTIDSRWRNRAEFPNGRQEIVDFLKRNGRKSWTIALLKSSGLTPGTASRFVSHTNGTTTPGIGFVPTAMRIGSLMTVA
jgi:Protein of unknown function (DUF1348)